MRLSIKKILFPVQRVAKIEASRAAAIFFFSTYFFFSKKILSIFGKKKKKKKVSSRTFLSHPADLPETEYFYGQPDRRGRPILLEIYINLPCSFLSGVSNA